jgi:hypothetical protein
MTVFRVLALTCLVMLSGCTLAASPNMTECEQFCLRQGKTVSDYRVGTSVPVFKRRPSVICKCG